jgi:FAD:protein FMN transferase
MKAHHRIEGPRLELKVRDAIERPLSEIMPARSRAAEVFMDTLVSIEVIAPVPAEDDSKEQIKKAFGWFEQVERSCSRFDPASELSCLCRSRGEPVAVSPLLFSLIDFALAVARSSGGAFDPTVGRQMEVKGFNKNYVSGEQVDSSFAQPGATWRDVVLDAKKRTVLLWRPLVLDLGAVAKGFAVDLAGAELERFPGYAINAGGDVLVKGINGNGQRWRIGIRHPRRPGELIDVLAVSDMAVCSSGDYERISSGDASWHHIVEPASGGSAAGVVSATVVAPTAVVADALSTAVFVLGPAAGLKLLADQGVEGMIVTSNLEVHETKGYRRFRL